jgi:hypothetical protein
MMRKNIVPASVGAAVVSRLLPATTLVHPCTASRRDPLIPLIALLAIALSSPLAAFQLSPEGTAEERRLADVRGGWIVSLERSAANFGLNNFGPAVHEEITERIYGCNADVCDGRNPTRAPAEVLAGVRWNDDPPFRISVDQGRDTGCKVTQTIRFRTQPRCWYQLFSAANKAAANGAVFNDSNDAAMLYRTHFGDLQFLHAMAARDGMKARDTQLAMLQWTEFNWRLMLGEFKLETELDKIDLATMWKHFGDSDWYVQDLYTQGSPGLRRRIGDVGFGSLLHLLQDSFSEAHADRASAVPSRTCTLAGNTYPAPGLIREFHAYNRQDHKLHGDSDSNGALKAHLQDTANVVDIGRVLLSAYEARRPWSEVAPYVECIYALAPNARDASPGDAYRSL